jgi:hypothetical protein
LSEIFILTQHHSLGFWAFWTFWAFWGNFGKFYWFLGYFFKFKKIMFEKKSDEKTLPCVKYSPLCVFIFEIFMFIPGFWVLITILKYFFNLNGYFSFTTTTEDSVHVKILDRNLFSKPFAFLYVRHFSFCF